MRPQIEENKANKVLEAEQELDIEQYCVLIAEFLVGFCKLL